MSSTAAVAIPRGTSRKERKALTRARLKAAAREAFAELGFSGTQIADVVRRAGVAQGTFYVHFESKEALLDEIVDEFNQELLVALAGAWGPGGPSLERREETVRTLAATCLDHWAAHRDVVGAFAERASRGADLGSLRTGISPAAGDFLRRGLGAAFATLAGDEERLELVLQGLLGMWMRVGLHYLFGEGATRATTIDVLVSMSLGALEGSLDTPRGTPPTDRAGPAVPGERS